ncbi:MAG: RNA polymerase sigma factor, partial [Pseudomonadota bacterium]
ITIYASPLMQDSVQPTDLDSTHQLIRRCNSGDTSARDQLARRCLPILQRWARGRLPMYGRDLAETNDLVQITVVRAFNNLDRFESKRQGAFLAYLRTILLSCAKDEIRRTMRSRKRLVPANTLQIMGASVEDSTIELEELEAFEAMVDRLPEPKRSAVILRVEMGFGYEQIAEELDCKTANAARMMIRRALSELAQKIDHEQ